MAEESNLIYTFLFSMTEYYQFTRGFQKAFREKSNDFKILFDDIYCSFKFFEYVDSSYRKFGQNILIKFSFIKITTQQGIHHSLLSLGPIDTNRQLLLLSSIVNVLGGA